MDTHDVFSFFKYASRGVFLYPFIRSLGLNIQIEDAKLAEFQFWPRFEDSTEPDLVLLIGDFYLLIESKFLSGFGKETGSQEHQLVREIEAGKYEAQNLGKIFRIIAVTADYRKPDIGQAIPPDAIPQFIWINWQQVAFFLYQTLGEGADISLEAKLFTEDLYDLLVKKNLRKFEGTRAFNGFHKFHEPPRSIFFSAITSSYRGDFIGFLDIFKQYKKNKKIEACIFFDTKTPGYCRHFRGFQELLTSSRLHYKRPPVIYYRFKINGDSNI